MLAGIDIMMRLFIGGLAFPANELLMDEVKMGVLAGVALAGFLVLAAAARKNPSPRT